MSRLWFDDLHVKLGPFGVDLQHKRGWLHKQTTDSHHLDCPPALQDNQPAWQAAAGALGEALQEPRWRRTKVHITLTDRLVRYQLLPWRAEVRNADERQAYAAYHFREVYGAIAETWEIRINISPPGHPIIACAIERELLLSLTQLVGLSRLQHLDSAFIAVFNRYRNMFKSRSAALANIDANYVCFAMFSNDRWIALRQRTLDTPATELRKDALLAMLEQERLLAEPPIDHATVYVAGDITGLDLSHGKIWTVMPLSDPVQDAAA